MKKILMIASTLLLLSSSQSFAHDSTWLVCTGKKLSVNVFSTRKSIAVTVIYGGHQYRVDAVPNDENNIVFEYVGDRNEASTSVNNIFYGATKIDFQANKVDVDAHIDFYDNGNLAITDNYKESISCIEMN